MINFLRAVTNPIEEAAHTALQTIGTFLKEKETSLREVRFVFLDPDVTGDDTAAIYRSVLENLSI